MQKRGIGHVEFILAFVLFIFVVSFAIIFLNPVRNNNLVGSSLTYAFREISKNVTTTLDRYYVKINVPNDVLAIALDDSGGSKFYEVSDYYGKHLNSSVASGSVAGVPKEILYVRPEGTNLIRISASKDLIVGDDVPERPDVNESEYTIASKNTNNILSSLKLEKLKVKYDQDYSAVKTYFKISNNVDFAFGVNYLDNANLIAQKNIPPNIEIFSNYKRIEILRPDASTVFGDFWVKIW